MDGQLHGLDRGVVGGTGICADNPQNAFIGFLNTATMTSDNNETVNSIGTNVPSTFIIADDSVARKRLHRGAE